ncbi:hypothetical protein D3C86_1594360 [compost metagenome]|uniref:hypothetical protein n=1 Tax=Variovorax boronicumulans TaxID=436515 RepID=UPI000FA847B1|nr:hypothetical protein [Variovorax boronicumulans]
MLKEFGDRLGEWLFGAFGVAVIGFVTVAAVCGSALVVKTTYLALISGGTFLVCK